MPHFRPDPRQAQAQLEGELEELRAQLAAAEQRLSQLAEEIKVEEAGAAAVHSGDWGGGGGAWDGAQLAPPPPPSDWQVPPPPPPPPGSEWQELPPPPPPDSEYNPTSNAPAGLGAPMMMPPHMMPPPGMMPMMMPQGMPGMQPGMPPRMQPGMQPGMLQAGMLQSGMQPGMQSGMQPMMVANPMMQPPHMMMGGGAMPGGMGGFGRPDEAEPLPAGHTAGGPPPGRPIANLLMILIKHSDVAEPVSARDGSHVTRTQKEVRGRPTAACLLLLKPIIARSSQPLPAQAHHCRPQLSSPLGPPLHPLTQRTLRTPNLESTHDLAQISHATFAPSRSPAAVGAHQAQLRVKKLRDRIVAPSDFNAKVPRRLPARASPAACPHARAQPLPPICPRLLPPNRSIPPAPRDQGRLAGFPIVLSHTPSRPLKPPTASQSRGSASHATPRVPHAGPELGRSTALAISR